MILEERENGTYYEPSTTRVYQRLECGNYLPIAELCTDTILNEPLLNGLEAMLK